MLEINELTRHTISIDFSDESGTPVTPDSFSFRVDVPNGAEVVPTTTVIPTGPTHQLVITAAWNKCTGNKDEVRRVTIVASELTAAEYLYKLHKLAGAGD